MDFAEQVGINMKRARRRAGLTLSDVATALDKSTAGVQQWEQGGTTSLNNINAYAQFVGVSVVSFFLNVHVAEDVEDITPLWEREQEAIGRHVMYPNEW